MPTKVGHKRYGRVAVEVYGRSEWDSHDSTKTWSDGGETRALLDELAPKLEAMVSRNVTLGVSDYAREGEAAMRVNEDGEIFVGLRLWNDEASLIVDIPLKQLLISALIDMRDRVAIDPGAQAGISQLVELGRQLLRLSGTPSDQSQTREPLHSELSSLPLGRKLTSQANGSAKRRTA